MNNPKLLNVTKFFKITMVTEFLGDERYLEIIDHSHSTRRKPREDVVCLYIKMTMESIV